MQIIYVIPDYYSQYPKPCIGGWGQQQLTVIPNWDFLPCPAAHTLKLPRATVREHSLAWIWEESPLFQRFRERSGCRSLAGVVSAARSISAVAAARRFNSPAMPRAPIRSATSRPTIGLWPRRFELRMRARSQSRKQGLSPVPLRLAE